MRNPAIVVLAVARARRRRTLQTRFGAEYDRTVEDADSRRRAEKELVERTKRRAQMGAVKRVDGSGQAS